MNKNIFGYEGLPARLTKEEVYEYFRKYKAGDISARDKIIRCNIRLVISEVVKKFRNFGYEEEELVSIGLAGLVKSVDKFDIDMNFEFSTFAVRCIDNEILVFMRNDKKHINNISLEDVIKTDDSGNKLRLGNIISDTSLDVMFNYEQKETNKLVRQIIENLPDREKKVIMLYFGFVDDKIYTQKEIATKLNISQPTICRLITKTLDIIKKALISYDDINVYKSESSETIDDSKKVLQAKKL